MRNLLLAAMLTLSLSAVAQADYVYEPLFKEGRVWKCQKILNLDEVEAKDDVKAKYEYYSYTLKGDTVMSDIIYHKVYLEREQIYGDSDWHYYAAVREDESSETAYIVYYGTDKEEILYDFDMQVGETVTTCNHVFEITATYYEFDIHGAWHKISFICSEYKKSNSWFPDDGLNNIWFSGFGCLNLFSQKFNDPFDIEEWVKYHDYKDRKNGYMRGLCTAIYDGDDLTYQPMDAIEIIIYPEPEWKTNVASPKVESDVEKAIHDTSGREASNYAPRGVYVKKGRKFLKK